MKKIIYLITILGIIITMTACGIKGEYKLIELTEEGRGVNIDTLHDLGLEFKLIINSEEDVLLTTANVTKKLIIEDNYLVGIDDEGEERSIPFTRDGNKITIIIDKDKMVFEK